jgi:hypothetical protein
MKTVTKNEVKVNHNADGIWLGFWCGICRKYHKVELKKKQQLPKFFNEDPATT